MAYLILLSSGTSLAQQWLAFLTQTKGRINIPKIFAPKPDVGFCIGQDSCFRGCAA